MVCGWCHQPLAYHSSTVNHIIPQSLGGGEGKNLRVSCDRCNQFRSVELCLLLGKVRLANGILRRLGVAELVLEVAVE